MELLLIDMVGVGVGELLGKSKKRRVGNNSVGEGWRWEHHAKRLIAAG